MTEMNRRTLLKGSVAMGAAALFGSEAAHAAGAVALPKKWDETTEVLIIGSGFAGLAAAIEAKKAGAKVEVLEKRLYRGFDGKARLISPRFLTALEPRLGNGI